MISFLNILNVRWVMYGVIGVAFVACLVTYQTKIKSLKKDIRGLKTELNISKLQNTALTTKLQTQNAAVLKLKLDEKIAKESYEKNLKLIQSKYKTVYRNVIVYRDGNCTQKLDLLEKTIGDYVK